MADSIIAVIADSLDPQSVSNALYETMVEWRSTVIEQGQSPSNTRADRLRRKRNLLEKLIGRFLNRDPYQTSELLHQHFFPGGK